MSEINRKRAIDALEAVVPHLADDWSAETDAELVEAVRLSLAVQSDYSPDGWSPTHWSPEYFAEHEADDLPPAKHPGGGSFWWQREGVGHRRQDRRRPLVLFGRLGERSTRLRP